MSHLAPVRKVWRKSFRGIPNVCSKRRRSSVATAPEVQAVTEDHSRFSGCPFHRPSPKLSTAVAAAEITPFHPALRTSKRSDLKSFDEIPTPLRLPCFGTLLSLFAVGGPAYMHEYCDKRHQQLGPIFKDRLGIEDCVVISEKLAIDTVFLNEGKHPVHMIPAAWELYNKLTGTKRGIFFMDGPEWRSRRSILNGSLMTPEAVAENADTFRDIIMDLMRRWEGITTDGWFNRGTIANLENELYNWSVESMASMLFGKRLGCIQAYVDKDITIHHEFVQCVRQIFEETAKMTMITPEFARSISLPAWSRFYDAATQGIKLARGYVEERMEEIRDLQNQGQKVTGVLKQLMDTPDVSTTDIVSIIADLIIAAADTTSHAVQWTLYGLARNPRCQEALLAQIRTVVGPGEVVEAHHLEKIPYAMFILREAMRLYPVASFLSRKLPVDVVLGGYKVPAEKLIVMSQYTIGRESKNFIDVQNFLPERWGKSQKKLNPGTKICTPFGVGARACVGKKIAECKAPLLICNVIQKFGLESVNRREVRTMMRMITAPDQPIKIRLHPRKN